MTIDVTFLELNTFVQKKSNSPLQGGSQDKILNWLQFGWPRESEPMLTTYTTETSGKKENIEHSRSPLKHD